MIIIIILLLRLFETNQHNRLFQLTIKLYHLPQNAEFPFYHLESNRVHLF